MKFIPNHLWSELKNLLPQKNTSVGRPEYDNQITMNAILYVLHTGIQWNMLPEKYGCHTTIHGKFMKWCRLGIFKKMMTKAREYYRKRNRKNNWYAFDTISRKAPFANFSGKNPTDRAKRGVKYGILVDRKGAPLFINVTPANMHDSKLLEPIIRQMKKSKKIKIIAADSAFDVKKLYSSSKEKNIALIASFNPRRKKDVHKFNVPHRWIVEQTFGILSWYRGLKICWNKTLESTIAFIEIACSHRLFKMAGIFG
jgi:putative transposase